MANVINFELAWEKAYKKWHETASPDQDMDSMFKAGYYAGLQDKEDEVAQRFKAFVRGDRVDK